MLAPVQPQLEPRPDQNERNVQFRLLPRIEALIITIITIVSGSVAGSRKFWRCGS